MKAFLGAGAMLGLLLLAASAVAADGIEVLGVAKAGDGSETDKAWKAYQVEERKQFDEAMKVLKDNEHGVQATVASGGAQASAVAGEDGFRRCGKFKATPADWVVRVKRMPCKEISAPSAPQAPVDAHATVTQTSTYRMFSQLEGAVKEGSPYLFSMIQGPDSGDWIAIKAGADSGEAEGTMQAQIAMLRKFLEKAGQPLTAAQDKEFEAMIKSLLLPGPVEAWEKVAAKPDDKVLAAAFVQAYLKAKDEFMAKMMAMSQKLMTVLTPAQLAAMGAPKSGVQESRATATTTSEAPGTYSVSSMNSDGKNQITIVIGGMRLGDAYKSLVESVNSTFNSKLAVPEVPADLAGKIVSAKIVLDGAEQALEKLAAAAGAKLEAKAGKTSIVSGGK